MPHSTNEPKYAEDNPARKFENYFTPTSRVGKFLHSEVADFLNLISEDKHHVHSLDKYILDGKGVCRHQNLVLSFLIAKAKKDRYLTGEFTIHCRRNYRLGAGHMWISYRNSNSKYSEHTSTHSNYLILDVTNDVISQYLKLDDDYRSFYNEMYECKPTYKAWQ